MAESSQPALKECFNTTFFQNVAREIAKVHPGFNKRRFLTIASDDLDKLSLLQRLRRTTEALHATLLADYSSALEILQKTIPHFGDGLPTLVPPDYVALYGRTHFLLSMEALKFFTPFGSSEFAVREFLKIDLRRSLKIMERWSRDSCEHVRRLASEGSRPRLPWSFRLEALIDDPSLTRPILENLKTDPSLYVRKSVANHLNDITKDHPDFVIDLLKSWDLTHPHTAWIARHALRSLLKAGNRRALALLGAGKKALVKIQKFKASPSRLQLGDTLTLSLQFTSLSRHPQKLIVDYAIHYADRRGMNTRRKVFKWKELVLSPDENVAMEKRQVIRDFTTRRHHPGRHLVEILINGEAFDRAIFFLARD